MASKKDNKEYTLKEAASKLDVSEATIKKYLKDFDLECQKNDSSKVIVSDETFKILTEITKLRANGLTLQEIKELRSEPSNKILEAIEDEGPKEVNNIEISEEPKVEVDSDSELNVAEEASNNVENDNSSDPKEEEEEQEVQEGQRRRNIFNYRYVERQISNDSKKITWLRQRLRNPNIGSQDKLLFEESLERRIMFLDGWKHILRWVSSK